MRPQLVLERHVGARRCRRVHVMYRLMVQPLDERVDVSDTARSERSHVLHENTVPVGEFVIRVGH